MYGFLVIIDKTISPRQKIRQFNIRLNNYT